MSADQVTAQDEEEIDADPAEAIEAARRFEPEERGVINRDGDDGERAEKIEPRLALARGEARVNFSGQRFATANLSFSGSEIRGQPRRIRRGWDRGEEATMFVATEPVRGRRIAEAGE